MAYFAGSVLGPPPINPAAHAAAIKKLHHIVARPLSFTMRRRCPRLRFDPSRDLRGARHQLPSEAPPARIENMPEFPAVGRHISMVFGLITRKIKCVPDRSTSNAPGIV